MNELEYQGPPGDDTLPAGQEITSNNSARIKGVSLMSATNSVVRRTSLRH